MAGTVTVSVSSGADVQDSSTLTLLAGEIARFRTTAFNGVAEAWYFITRNAVTSYHPISSGNAPGPLEADDRAMFTTDAVSGDTVGIRIRLNGQANSSVVGILETMAV